MVTISKFEWWPLQRMAQRWVGEVKHLVFPPTPTTCPLGPTDHLGLGHLALFILPAPTFLTSPFCKHSLQFTVLPDASRCSPSYDGPSPFPPIRAPSVSTTLCRSYTGHHSHWWHLHVHGHPVFVSLQDARLNLVTFQQTCYQAITVTVQRLDVDKWQMDVSNVGHWSDSTFVRLWRDHCDELGQMAAIPFVCPRGKKGEWMCVQFPFRVICTHSDLLTALHWIVFFISLFGGDSLVICRCHFTPTPYATSGCNARIHARLICLVEQLFKK